MSSKNSGRSIKRPAFRNAWKPAVAVVALLGTYASIAAEMRYGWLQARLLASVAERLSYQVGEGPSPAIRFPSAGPFDLRNGYVQLPGFVDRLRDAGFVVKRQARQSESMLSLSRFDLPPIFREKATDGLKLLGGDGLRLFDRAEPDRRFGQFDAVPSVIVKALLFIEDRDLLDEVAEERNPAVSWSRLFYAVYCLTLDRFLGDRHVPGASTLATQLEKFRHFPDGRTRSTGEKARQMAAASLRAYLSGEDTGEWRRQIVVDYLDSLPLGSRMGHGEVLGLGEGLATWYGAGLGRVKKSLAPFDDTSGERLEEPALSKSAYVLKQAVSLFIAQRRPAFYFRDGMGALDRLTDSYLSRMAARGIVSREVSHAAGKQVLTLSPSVPEPDSSWHKAATVVRSELSRLLGVESYYDLDRLDLEVSTTVHSRIQKRMAKALRSLEDPDVVAKKELNGPHLLAGRDPGGVLYSLTLYEHAGDANLLRLQTDNFDGPFDLNDGGKLELGSTAKLRTLISYLETVARLQARYSVLSRDQLAKTVAPRGDALAGWVIGRLEEGEVDLPALLEQAMSRRYSASPAASFFTGGGVHRFANFSSKYDQVYLTVREAFQQSVNLVFIRIMKDVVDHVQAEVPEREEILKNPEDSRRRDYLERFADYDGTVFLTRFYDRYSTVGPADLEEALLASIRPLTARRIAAAYTYLHPQGDVGPYLAQVAARIPSLKLTEKNAAAMLRSVVATYPSLADRAHVAGLHPLELWLVAHLRRQPAEGGWNEVVAASRDARQDAYAWLFRSAIPERQNRRIEQVMEADAFDELAKDWHRVGYPFPHLIPSLATAIGSSGDRPAALAELAGIIVNGGIRYPKRTVTELRFAAGTPYETVAAPAVETPQRVLSQEVADVVREALLSVVESGTARGVRGSFDVPGGVKIPIGGKTGTGDNRYGTAAGGIMNRTATFVFFLGDRFFGTVTAYAPEARRYRFTSALPVKILAMVAPQLLPIVLGEDDVSTTTVRDRPAAPSPDESKDLPRLN